MVDYGPSLDEPPDVVSKRWELCLNLQKRPGIADGGGDLEAVANDARVDQQLFDLSLAVAGDSFGIKAIEGTAKILALRQDSLPTQSRLGSFQYQEFEQP